MKNMNRGFTLIEILLVIAIMAILLGLLLPAVQKVRQAAGRLACQNNLKQIGLAAHHYHDVYNCFPSGSTSDLGSDPYPCVSWLTRLLPYLEQEQLWSRVESAYSKDRRPFMVPPHSARGTVVKMFICPIDDRIQVAGKHYIADVAFTSYLGVQGEKYSSSTGTLYPDSKVGIAMITDGTSQTLLAGERPPSSDLNFGWWYTGVGQNDRGSIDVVLGVREQRVTGNPFTKQCEQGPYFFTNGSLETQCDVFHFWSLHSGGSNFIVGDGSVRFLAYSANPIMLALATRAGGEVVELP